MASEDTLEAPFTNGLSPAEAERLSIMAEECGEVIKAIMKILRHGYESDWNGQLRYTNRETLAHELGDLAFLFSFLIENKDVSEAVIGTWAEMKKLTINNFLHHNKVELLPNENPRQD